MRSISARQANQEFSKILEAAVQGEEVTITRRGVPVAKLVPIADPAAEAERRRKIQALVDRLDQGPIHGGVVADWTRDELYDRD